eukprot:TRINITY_DN29568_c0_g1_i1.p1 TRINITY_DN29568_c0_g1~~TRINITY_DN29568_c0_g1_i1.p1  ORF type:complete len:325 (-),score=95.13 TRINITY_DN29568_c0_g1_i1:32-1006(-)
MVNIAAAHGEQASRAAGFWDDFYATGGASLEPLELDTAEKDDADAQEETTPNYVATASGSVEWILEPEVVLPGILSAIDKMAMRPRRIVEIGCGDSVLAQRLYEAFEGGVQVTATDISEVALSRSRARAMAAGHAVHPVDGADCGGSSSSTCSSSGREALRYCWADATDLSPLFKEGSVDVVVDKGMQDTLQFRAKTAESQDLRRRLFAEVFRVLAPGGCYVVCTPKARLRFLRTVPWESIDRKALKAPAGKSALLVRGSADAEVFVHACAKPSEEAAAREAMLPPAPTEDAEPEHCASCGVARRPRYRSDASWAKHQTFCGGA